MVFYTSVHLHFRLHTEGKRKRREKKKKKIRIAEVAGLETVFSHTYCLYTIGTHYLVFRNILYLVCFFFFFSTYWILVFFRPAFFPCLLLGTFDVYESRV